MESSRKRQISDGREFDHLFPLPSEEDRTIKGSASVEDTMEFIQRTVPVTLWHTEKIAKKLKGKTLEETCSNIWHFVYNHIQYKRDKDGVEQVRSPRRTWWERETGVDCDCYTEFISSILLNLNLPHKARITKYPKRYPEVPRWQHVYPIVPKPGRGHKPTTNRDDYIVLDCVKDNFDDEQPFLEYKDYDMRLDYLDGIEEQEEIGEEESFELMDIEPDSVDLADLASIYDDEEMGNIFKKIGKAVKKVASNVKTATKVVAKQAQKTVKKVADKVGDGVRFLNRYLNPATILLRNGFLLCMKLNLFNVAGKLRFAYLTDAQAQAMGMNLNELKKLRTIKDRAETIYWQAGGKKSNLKKGILSGKGNKNKKVPLSGFEGLDGLDNVYADYDEYNIIHSDGVEGLGEIASGTAIAAATSAVTAIAAALKQVKGLFNKGGSEEQAFQSETDNAGSASSAPANIPEDEDALTFDTPEPSQAAPSAPSYVPRTLAPTVQQSYTPPPAVSRPPVITQPPSVQPKSIQPFAPQLQQEEQSYQETTEEATSNETEDNTPPAATAESVLPSQYTADRRSPATTDTPAKSTALQTQNNNQEKEGFLQKTTTWVKQNPGTSLLVAGGVIAGSYLLVKALKGESKSTNGLGGPPKGNQSKRKYTKRNKVKPINLL
jgi:ElaB/YqjD/DUF883 family membrane-anchored ribosome-binding protein